MKVLKKYFKLVMCFMAFALCSFLMVFAPTMTVLAAESNIANYAKSINSVNMPKVVDAKDGLKIPFLTDVFGATYTVKVVDPSGYIHTCEIDSSTKNFIVVKDGETDVTQNGNGYFAKDGDNGVVITALTKGEYKVLYTVKDGDNEYYSNTYTVTVENVSYELDFTKDGLKMLVAPEVAQSTDEEKRIAIPVPSAKIVGSTSDAGDPLIENEIRVTYNGVGIDLYDEENDAVDDATDFIKDADGNYFIQPSKVGIYKIQYTYKRGVNRPTKTITIKVSNPDTFVEPTEFKVSTTPTFPTIELGKEGITLPTLTAKNEFESNVEYNLKSIKVEKESDSSIFQVLENNNYTLNMTMEAFNATEGGKDVTSYEELKGNYIVTYTLVNAYGKETTYTKRIEGVTASTKPTISLVYDYTVDADKNVVGTVNKGAETQLQNKYGYDEIILPAVYAEDLVSDSSELIVVRTLRNVNSSKSYYVDNLKYNSSTGELEEVNYGEQGYNYTATVDETLFDSSEEGQAALAKAQAEAEKVGNINQAVQFKFDDDDKTAAGFAGEYQLEYRVIAKNVVKRENTLTETGSSKYKFTVLANSLDINEETNLTAEITNVEDKISVDKNEELTVKFSSNDDVDTRLKNVVFYYYETETSIENALNNTTRLSKDNIINALKTLTDDKTSHVLDKTELLTALSSYTDITKADLNEAKDGYIINFNTHGEEDPDDKFVGATIVAVTYNDYGNVAIDTRTLTFKNTVEKDAPVHYSVTDNGSFTPVYDDVETTKIKELVLNIAPKMGDVVTLPTFSYTDADESLQMSVVYYIKTPVNESTGIQYMSPANKSFSGQTIKGGKITIEQSGTYYVVYTATDDAGNTNVTYLTFTVASTAKPLFSVNASGEDIEVADGVITAEAGTTISFDTIVKDGDTKQVVSANITVDVEDNGLAWESGNDTYSYTFNGVGTYTLTFTAKYLDREAVKVVKTVKVTAPTLEWNGEFEFPESADAESEVYLPVVSANYGTVKVTVKDPNGKELTVEQVAKDSDGNNGPFYKFTTTTTEGIYKVKYTATSVYGTLEKELTLKVGDNVEPTITFNHKAELQQNIVYDGTNQIQIKFDVDKYGSDKHFIITATSNGETIYSYDLGLDITDNKDTYSSWSELEYEVTGDSGVLTKDSDDLYLISGTGTFTINISYTDNNQNTAVEPIVFKVVTESEAEEENDTVVGIVLIVISLVVLAGVILFFLLTGKKGGSKTTKKVVKNAKAKVENLTENKEEVKTEEVEEETATETVEETAKEGEIEE